MAGQGFYVKVTTSGDFRSLVFVQRSNAKKNSGGEAFQKIIHNAELWRRVGKFLDNHIVHGLFSLQRDEMKQPWAKLKESTIRKKTRKGVSNPSRILYETGKMQKNSSRIKEVTEKNVRIYWDASVVPYAKYHETGYYYFTKKGNFVDVPARPVLGLGISKETRESISNIILEWIKQNV